MNGSRGAEGGEAAKAKGDPGPSPSRGDALIFRALLLLLALVATLSPIRNYDYWWHLETGRMILEQRAIPRADVYSFTAAGTPWVDHEWLSEVLLYLGQAALGPAGLVLIKSVLVIGLCSLIWRFLEREGHGSAGASVLLLLALAGSAFRLDARPELATLLLVPLCLHLALWGRDQNRLRPLAAIVALTALGANLHVGIILLPVFLAAGAGGLLASAALKSLRGTPGAVGDRRWALRLAVTALLSGVAMSINPYGIKIYAAPFHLRRLLASLPLQNQEWVRPTPDEFPLFFAVLGVSLLVLALGFRHLDPIAAPALLLSGLLAALYLRNIGLFFLLVPYGLARPARGLVASVKRLPLYRIGTQGEAVRPGFVLAAALLLSGVPLLLILPPRPAIGMGMAPDNEPAAAVDFLEREQIGRRLFNEVRFGGYLIWRRFPRDHVFIDSRNEIYGDLLRDIGTALPAPDRWKAFIDGHQIDAALLRYPPTLQKVIYPGRDGHPPRTGERAFSSAYFPSQEWALVYWDDDAMAFVRRTPESQALIARLEYRALNPDDWRYLWASVLIRRIPVEPILEELRRKLHEDPECARAQELLKRFAAFVAPADATGTAPQAGG